MTQQLPIQSLSFRFKRWSRQSYAVFATLGKAVTIGRLSVHMATRILFEPVIRLISGSISDSYSEPDKQEDENAVENALLIAAMPVITNTFADAAASVVINIDPYEPRSEQMMLFRPWFFNSLLFKPLYSYFYA